MSPKRVQKVCDNPPEHAGHICELESRQEWDMIRCVTDHPVVRCENCGSEANSSRNVCIPSDL